MPEATWARPELAPPPGSGRKRHIGIVLPLYNEEGNLRELYNRLLAVFAQLPGYTFEMLFMDNASTDGSERILRELAASDPRVKVIFNARNFGQLNSPFHGVMQVGGDAVMPMATDLQDPPELIPEFVRKWEEGYQIVVGVKTGAAESGLMYVLRTIYYKLARKLAEVELLEHVTGYGLYDRRAVEIMRRYGDPHPYTRGMLVEMGLPLAKVPYQQPARFAGVTTNNFLSLFDVAILGITAHSRLPMRIATLAGFVFSVLSFVMGMFYLIGKLLFWNWFEAGVAPVLVGMFFLGSIQLLFIGLIGEYVGAVLTWVKDRPLVVERERLGFDAGPGRLAEDEKARDRV